MHNQFINNSIWIIGGRIFQMALSLIISMLTARYLGPSNYGLINYAASFVAFCTPICTLGFNSIMVNEILSNREETGKIIGTSIAIRLLASLCSIIGIIVVVFFLNAGESETLLITILYSVSLLFQCFDSINYFYQADMLSKYPVIASSVAYIVVAGYKILLLVNEKSVRYFAFANSLDLLIVGLLLVVIYIKQRSPRLVVSFDVAKRLLGKGYHFVFSGLMVAIYTQTDKIMLKSMLQEDAVGFYSCASNICILWIFILAAIVQSARPILIEHYNKKTGCFENKLIQLYSAIIYISLFVSVIFSFFAEPIILILYGQAYLPAATPLRILTWATMFSYLGVARSIWSVCENCQNYEKTIALCGAIVNVILNLFLINLFAENGASLATLATQIVTNLIIGFAVPKLRQNSTYIIKAFRIEHVKPFLEQYIINHHIRNDASDYISRWFDIGKVFALFSIVSAHVLLKEYPEIQIYYTNFGTVGVIFFLIASGYYYRPPKKIADTVRVKVKTVVTPWLTLGIITFLIQSFLASSFSLGGLIQWVFGYKSYLYFVVILLMCFLLFFRQNTFFIILSIIINVISIVATQFCGLNEIISSIGLTNYLNVFNWVGFFAFGLLVRNIEPCKLVGFIKKNRAMFLLAFAVMLFWLSVFNYELNYFNIIGIFFELMGCLALMSLSSFSIFDNKFFKMISAVSYGVYLSHMIFIHFLSKLYLLYPTTAFVSNIIIVCVLAFLFVVGFYLSKVLNVEKIYLLLCGIRTRLLNNRYE